MKKSSCGCFHKNVIIYISSISKGRNELFHIVQRCVIPISISSPQYSNFKTPWSCSHKELLIREGCEKSWLVDGSYHHPLLIFKDSRNIGYPVPLYKLLNSHICPVVPYGLSIKVSSSLKVPHRCHRFC